MPSENIHYVIGQGPYRVPKPIPYYTQPEATAEYIGGWACEVMANHLGFERIVAPYHGAQDNVCPNVLLQIHCNNLDMNSPIGEIHFGLHEGGVISIMVAARPGAKESLTNKLIEADNEFHILDNQEAMDQRFRVGVTSGNLPDLMVFMEGLTIGVASFSQQMIDIWQGLLTSSFWMQRGVIDPFGFQDKFIAAAVGSKIKRKHLWNPVAHWPVQENMMSIVYNNHVAYYKNTNNYRYIPWVHGQCPQISAGDSKKEPHEWFVRAIINGHEQQVQYGLKMNPKLAAIPDAHGNDPVHIALDLGYESIARTLLLIRMGLPDQGYGEQLRVELYYKDMNCAETMKYNGKKREGRKAKYLKELESVNIPEEPLIHKRVKQNNVLGIRELLKDHSQAAKALNGQGFSAAMVAAGLGHHEALYWLLEAGAETYYRHKGRQYSLLDSAATPAAMRVALFFKTDPHLFSSRLREAIECGDCTMVAIMLDYGVNALPLRSGLTPFHIAFEQALRMGKLEVLNTLLLRHNELVFTGPYDSAVSHKVVERLREHNEKYVKRYQNQVQRPKHKVTTGCTDVPIIVTRLENDYYEVISIIKPASHLTEEERGELYDLFWNTFELQPEAGEASLTDQEYMEAKFQFFLDTFPDEGSNGVSVEFCAVKEKDPARKLLRHKIVSFYSFKIVEVEDPKEPYVAVLGKLAATHPDYTDLGLPNFFSRVPLLEKTHHPNKPVYRDEKFIPEGFSWMMPPRGCDISPRYYFENQERIRHVTVQLAKDEWLAPGVSKAKLVVKKDAFKNNPIVDEFNALRLNPVHPDPAILNLPPEEKVKLALPGFVEINRPNSRAYYKEKLEHHHMYEGYVEGLSFIWARYKRLAGIHQSNMDKWPCDKEGEIKLDPRPRRVRDAEAIGRVKADALGVTYLGVRVDSKGEVEIVEENSNLVLQSSNLQIVGKLKVNGEEILLGQTEDGEILKPGEGCGARLVINPKGGAPSSPSHQEVSGPNPKGDLLSFLPPPRNGRYVAGWRGHGVMDLTSVELDHKPDQPAQGTGSPKESGGNESHNQQPPGSTNLGQGPKM